METKNDIVERNGVFLKNFTFNNKQGLINRRFSCVKNAFKEKKIFEKGTFGEIPYPF